MRSFGVPDVLATARRRWSERPRQSRQAAWSVMRGMIEAHHAAPSTATCIRRCRAPTALLPYLDDYWRDQIVNRHIHKQSFHLQSYPPNSPLSCRPDWRPKDGSAGQRSRPPARAGARRLRLALRHLQHAARRDLAVQRGHGGGADLGGERLHRQGMARPRAAAARVDPVAAAQSRSRGEGDRAARARQALRAGADAGDGRDAARDGASTGRSTRRANGTASPSACTPARTYRTSPTAAGWPSYQVEDYIAQSGSFENQLAELHRRGRVPEISRR